MNQLVEVKRYALAVDELHTMTTSAIRESEHTVFGGLPSLIGQIIERKTWLQFGHETFASYALCDTSDGLRVTNNQRLYILRCAMTIHGDATHLKEWGEVLVEVEERVREWAKERGINIREFNGNSLESLAKNVYTGIDGINYLPSGQTSPASKVTDGNLVRLHRRDPKLFRKVVTGKMSLIEARKAAGMRVNNATPLVKARSVVRHMTDSERQEFIQWLREEGYL